MQVYQPFNITHADITRQYVTQSADAALNLQELLTQTLPRVTKINAINNLSDSTQCTHKI